MPAKWDMALLLFSLESKLLWYLWQELNGCIESALPYYEAKFLKKEWSLSESFSLFFKKNGIIEILSQGTKTCRLSDSFYNKFYPVMIVPAVLLFQVVARKCFRLAISNKMRIFQRFGIWTPFFFLQSIRKYQFKVLEKSDSLWFVLKIKYCSWKLFLQFPQCVMLTLTFSKGNALRNFDYKNSALWAESRNLEGGWEKCFI